jgi:hypothetical protein
MDAAWLTCPDTLAPSHLNRAMIKPGTVAADAEHQRRVKYSTLSAAYTFIPVAVETLSALGDEAMSLLLDVGRCIATVTEDCRPIDYLFQRLSKAIQQGNAARVLGTVSPEICVYVPH